MAINIYLDPTGLEGFYYREIPESMNPSINRVGNEGFYYRENTFVETPSSGLSGFGYTFDATEKFIQITDFRGRPIQNATVTAKNTGGDVSGITDSDGIVALVIDVGTLTDLVVSKEKTFIESSYNEGNESLIKTIILQPPLL